MLKHVTLEEFRTLLYLVKFRHRVPGVFLGWIFGPRRTCADCLLWFSPVSN